MLCPPIVETQSGKVEGVLRGAHAAFLGIPYARAPVGELRFRAPEPPPSWSGVRAASAFGASAPQGAMFAPGVVADGPQSEDCLFLNVFTPVDVRASAYEWTAAGEPKRAVMVWIHGGAFTVGSASSPLYDGRRLAEEHGVVVVTLNYRLGLLGYLPFGEDGERWGALDNRGLHDQLAALRWVRANIHAFGGDPDNVTVFGESAGATSVGLLLATPQGRGLFRRAIAQSTTGPLILPTADDAEARRAKLLKALDLPTREPERLAHVPLAALMRAQAEVEAQTHGWPHFHPVVDRALLPAQPAELLRSGQGDDVPLITGTNRDEWNLFALMALPEWSAPLAEADAIARFAQKLPAGASTAAPELFAIYRASRRARGLPHDERALLRALEGDLRFRIPTLRFAELHRARAETYVYLFSHGSPALGGALGACHALELPFVFGTYDAPNQDRFAGEGEAVVRLSRAMREAWTSFAKEGIPRAADLPAWPRYELARRPTLDLSAAPSIVEDPLGEERAAWEGRI